MQCENPFIHTIKPNDTLYSLAIRYETTVSKILAMNPGVDIYNLQIGTGLLICPGSPATPVPPVGTVPPITPVPPVGTVPTLDILRELFLLILRWVREKFGEEDSQSIIENLGNELNKR